MVTNRMSITGRARAVPWAAWPFVIALKIALAVAAYQLFMAGPTSVAPRAVPPDARESSSASAPATTGRNDQSPHRPEGSSQ